MLHLSYAMIGSLEPASQSLPLSAYRLERLARIKAPLTRQQSLGAELLLIRALRQADSEAELPLNIAVGQNGKPYFPENALCFSLSHSDQVAFCALSDRELGADAERERPYNEKLARRFFTETEQKYIALAADRAYAFTQVWTLKESYIKAIGKGLSLPLNSFSVPLASHSSVNCGAWSFWHSCQDGVHFAVCAQGDVLPDIFEKVVL